jgi:hypothetical protein
VKYCRAPSVSRRNKLPENTGCTGWEPRKTRPTRWDSPVQRTCCIWNEETAEPVLPRRPGKFDSRVVEPGPPPIVTRDGIVLIYNVRTTIWFTARASQYSTEVIRAKCCTGANNRCSSPNENGRKTGKCQTLCSSRAWPKEETSGFFITAARINTLAWPPPQPSP